MEDPAREGRDFLKMDAEVKKKANQSSENRRFNQFWLGRPEAVCRYVVMLAGFGAKTCLMPVT